MLGSFVDDVVRSGAVQVISVKAHRRNPAFSYTVGRYRNFGEPELLMLGVGFPRAGIALHDLSGQMEVEPHLDRWRLRESGLVVRTRTISRARVERFMRMAVAHYGHSDFPALEAELLADYEAA